jgi:hypothetical protein
MSKASAFRKPTAPHDIQLHVLNKSMDPFEAKNGYNYDYVFVFKVHDETVELTSYQKEFSTRNMLQRLGRAGLQTKMFYSTNHDMVLCKIRASLERLCKEANRINFKLELEPTELKKAAEAGVPDCGIAPFYIYEETEFSKQSAYQNIFAKVRFVCNEHTYRSCAIRALGVCPITAHRLLHTEHYVVRVEASFTAIL